MAINLCNAMIYDLSFVVVVFSLHFLKENLFEGVPVWEVFAPNVYLGVKKMCKKFCEILTFGLDLLRVTVFTTPPNC